MGFKDQFTQALAGGQAPPQQAVPQQAQPPWGPQQQQAAPQQAVNPFASYMGVEAATPREPHPYPGKYRLRLKSHDEWHSQNPKSRVKEWFKAVFDVVEALPGSGSAVGDEVCYLQGKNVIGIPLIRGFWEQMSGLVGPAFDQAVAAGQISPASLYGRDVYAKVTQGNPREDDPSDYYRIWEFESVN